MGCLGSLIGLVFGIISAVFGLVFGIVGSVLSGVGVIVLVLLPVLTLIVPILLIVGILWVFARPGRGAETRRQYSNVHRQRPAKEERPIDDDSEVVDVDEWEEFPDERSQFERDEREGFQRKDDDGFNHGGANKKD